MVELASCDRVLNGIVQTGVLTKRIRYVRGTLFAFEVPFHGCIEVSLLRSTRLYGNFSPSRALQKHIRTIMRLARSSQS
jgi:hypothetical protein